MNTCPKCGETQNFHYNYDYTKAHRPVVDILCKNCGELFLSILNLPKEKPKQETIEETAARLFTEERFPTSFETLRKAFVSNAKFNTAKSERMYNEENLYSEIESLIIMWSNDGTKTAGALTRQIMEKFKKK